MPSTSRPEGWWAEVELQTKISISLAVPCLGQMPFFGLLLFSTVLWLPKWPSSTSLVTFWFKVELECAAVISNL